MKRALLAATLVAAFGASAETIHIKMVGMQATPNVAVVHKGDTIIWENADIVPHTVTEDTKGKPRFDSGVLNVGSKFHWVVKGKGEIHYKCLLHPTMTAKLIVK
jgi:plastocyanin